MGRRALLAAAALGAAAASGRVYGQAPTFVASVDRRQVPLDATIVYEVTLTASGGRPEGFQAPEFKGFRVVAQHPSRFTQMRMSPGRSFVQEVYSWRYEIQPLRKGNLTIGAARIRVAGHELRTAAVTVSVGDRLGGAPPPAAAGASAEPAVGDPHTPPPSFLRVVADKPRVFVGEQVTVAWYLYITERQDKYQTISEPRTDSFWSEDLPVPSMRAGLALTQETYAGRSYEAALLLRKALFPLQAGKLVVGPMESEIAQVDFFGAALRSHRLRSEPLTIDVLPLPTAGQPPGFDPSAVGRFSIAASADRASVSVGEAVTLTIEIKGRGNVRKLRPPRIPRLEGWKSYEPQSTDTVSPGEVVEGVKKVEVLLVPERPGAVVLAAVALPFFDPIARRYEVTRADALPLEALGGGTAPVAGPAGPHAAPGGIDNLIPVEVRPIHATPVLRRDIGATLYRSPAFLGLVAAPPLALGLLVAVHRLRERLAADTARTRRRRVRRLVRRRLGAAEDHRDGGRTALFFIEIDRVLREVIATRLGRSVTGLRMGELRSLLAERGVPDDLGERVIAELETCDQARFAPGSASPEDMGAVLDRGGELILRLEKARLREGREA